MAKDQAPIPTDLNEMKKKLAEWRSAQSPRTRLPESLWQSIVDLASRHGLYRTAKSLPVDYGTLKRRYAGQQTGRRRRRIAPPSFVELVTPPLLGTGSVVELVRIEAQGTIDWTQLLEAWRRRGA